MISRKLRHQHLGIDIPLRRRRRIRELRRRDQEPRDGWDTIGPEEGELQGLLEGEGEFELGDGLLDEEGVVEGHAGEGLAGGEVGKALVEGSAEAVGAEEPHEENVGREGGEENGGGLNWILVGPWKGEIGGTVRCSHAGWMRGVLGSCFGGLDVDD